MSRGRRRAGTAAVGALVATLLVLGSCGEDGAGERVAPPTTTPTVSVPPVTGPRPSFLERCPTTDPTVPARADGLPDLTLPCLGRGPAVRLAGLAGEPTLVNVWASWCPPCRDELPYLQSVHEDGLAVLGIDAEDLAGPAAALLDTLGVTFPSVYDPQNTIGVALGIPSKPLTLFVSAQGEVVHAQIGAFTSESEVRELAEQYLGVQLP